MSNILKMVKLDFSLVKPYMKTVFIVFLSPLIVMYTTRDILSGMIFCMSMMAITSSYTFSVAEKNDLGRLYGLLPVSKSDIVSGRYLFVGLQGIITTAFAICANLIILILLKVHFGLSDVLISTGIGLVLYYFFTAVQMPFFFKFGGIKGRFFAFLPFIGIFSLSAIAKGLRPEQLARLSSIAIINSPFGILVLGILLSIIFYSISIGITQKIYDKMEL